MCTNISIVVMFGTSVCFLQMKPVSDYPLEQSSVDNHSKGILDLFGEDTRLFLLEE